MASSNMGRFIWHEHMTKDPQAAIAFYGAVVGWKTQAFGDDYTMWVSSQGPMGAVMKLPEAAAKMGAPPHWMGSVEVADVDASASEVRKLGGKVYMEPMDIPTVGRYAVIADPQGAVISLFKPGSAMALHDASKPGEFCWNELFTSDPGGAFGFYSKLFGWTKKDELDMGPMGKYLIYGVGDVTLGGIMKKPESVPVSRWVYYAEVSDLDAAMARAKTQGGKVLMGPQEVPGGGRIAQLTDPQGAVFALHQAAKK